MSEKRNIAVILAGGVGSRLGLSMPKQFLKVAGKMVLEHTIEVFEHHVKIDEIAIVSNPFYVSDIEDMVMRNGWKKVAKILEGGKERYYSSLSAIKAYGDDDVNLIFHDAVRPLVSHRIIDDVVDALHEYSAVDVAMPSTDTIIEVEGDFISHIPDRSKLRRGQTPQAFHISTIRKAYDLALQDPDLKVTDDCGVVCKYLPDVPVYVVKGEESNMKLTYKEDTFLLDKYFQMRRTEVGDTPLTEGLFNGRVAVVFGSSQGIGKETVDLLRNLGSTVYGFSRSAGNVDVSERTSVAKALSSVSQKCGKIDYVIDTAGVLNRKPLVAMCNDDIERGVSTNFMGVVNVALESYEYLKASHGKLIFFTSSSYTRGRAFYSIYSSTKAAIVNFVQAIAQEWDSSNICVNCINPERTKTPMRIRNFGVEPDDSLLDAKTVALATARTLLSDYTGQVVDVKKK